MKTSRSGTRACCDAGRATRYRPWSVTPTRRIEWATLVLAGIAAIALQGCAASSWHQKYPADWPALTMARFDGKCPDLSGVYVNRPEKTFPENSERAPSLSELFSAMGAASTSPWHGAWPPIADAVSVSFEQTSDRLVVEFTAEAGANTPLAFQHLNWRTDALKAELPDRFDCKLEDTRAYLHFFNEVSSQLASGAPLAVQGGGTVLMFGKATDGALIVEARSESMTLSVVLIGSKLQSTSIWYRYPALRQALEAPASQAGEVQ
jgi:hypothetical protein